MTPEVRHGVPALQQKSWEAWGRARLICFILLHLVDYAWGVHATVRIVS